MSPRISVKRRDRATAAIVALAMLLGGIPLTFGTPARGSETMFTLNICHPVQSFSHSSVAVAAIMPVPPAVARMLPECAGFPVPHIALRTSATDAPDPPPPKART